MRGLGQNMGHAYKETDRVIWENERERGEESMRGAIPRDGQRQYETARENRKGISDCMLTPEASFLLSRHPSDISRLS